MYNTDLMSDFFDSSDDCDVFSDGHCNRSKMSSDYPRYLNSINISRSMSKTELAAQLGITRRTLQRWLNRIGEENIPGYRKGNKILTPGVLKYLSERLCF